jgi:hypothetical protein
MLAMWTDQVNVPTGQTLPQPLCVTGLLILTPLGRLWGRPRPLRGTAKVANVGSIIGTAARDMPNPGGFPEEHHCRVDHRHSLRAFAPRVFTDTSSPLFTGATLPSRTLQTNRAGPKHQVGPEKSASLCATRPARPCLADAAARPRRGRLFGQVFPARSGA